MPKPAKPTVLITGAAGSIGRSLATALEGDYRVFGLDLVTKDTPFPCFHADITSDRSVDEALARVRRETSDEIAAVVHLAAYFDFTGEESPLYGKVNEEGTRRFLRALQSFRVGRFVYSGTMLIHSPGRPGELIDEESPIEPRWAYPKSKAATEEIILAERGDLPVALLRLAGLYDEQTAVPTLSHQIARIYERDLKSHLYAGDLDAGQALIHRDDMIDLFRRVVDRRDELPEVCPIVAGEPEAVSYRKLQQRLGELIHGREDWPTLALPPALAKAGAWLEEKSEPVVPDDFDYGEKPFIRPFMVDMASHHYQLDIRRARDLLGWQPRHSILDELPDLVASLKADPYGWYKANGITPPHWLSGAEAAVGDPNRMRELHDRRFRLAHRDTLWARWFNLAMATWLVTSPPLLGYTSPAMTASDVGSGILLAVFGFIALSWRHAWARWACAAIGLWVLSAPLVFWAPDATAYLNGTLVGGLVVGFAVLVPPWPGISALAARSGPTLPPGWSYSPSNWFQRMPVIILALVGLYVSRYLAAYQLDYVDGVFEPFFSGTSPGKNGTESIITSSVSKAWPVPDAGVGGLTYMLEILVGAIGAANRWRTMPWIVMLFGILIVPLGMISIYFIVIQPVLLGTYCTLCLVAAAAMLLQIPYSLDELVATGQFLARRYRAGRPVLKIFFIGDTDEGSGRERDDFERTPWAIAQDMATGGMSLPWNLAASIALGAGLMLTPLVFDLGPGLAGANHIAGALVLTVTVTALALVARAVRLLNVAIGAVLILIPFAFEATFAQMAADILAGFALVALNLRRGAIGTSYGSWDRYIL